MYKRQVEASRCHLENGNTPQEPRLREAEKADTEGYLREIFQILPLVGLRAFEIPRIVSAPQQQPTGVVSKKSRKEELDTIIVPAQLEGFERVFIGEDCWYAIRISGGMLDKIKYIAAYWSSPREVVHPLG